MKRRLMLAFVAAMGLLALACSTDAQDRPNVLVIISDDAGYADFGFQGSKKVPTTNLDALAARGVAFSNAYAGSVCSPSRAMLTTGMYTARIGYSNNIASRGFVTQPITQTPHIQGLPTSAVTIWQRMQGLGYSTACVGKWHLGSHPNGQRDGQVVPGNVPQNQGVEHFRGIIAGSRTFWVGEATGTQTLRWIESDGKGKVSSDRIVEADHAGEYITDTFGDMTVDYIRRHASGDEPFFMYSSFTAPHNPMHATEEDLAAIDKLGHDLKPNRKIQVAMQYALDRNIGKILASLDDPNGDGDTADSIRDNTLIIFINDNGGDSHDSNPNYSSNWPLRHGKGSQWEGGIRVPMIVAGWGLDPAYRDDDLDVFNHPVHIIDILPTAFAAGGGSLTEDDVIDGVDLLPYLNDADKGEPHETLFLRRFSGEQHAVRQGDYKLMHRPKEGYMLFDVVSDRGEKNNLAGQMPELVEQLKRVMTDYDVLMDKPRFDNMALKVNPFYDFRFREGVSESAKWSDENIWIDTDRPVQATMTTYDACPNTALVFRNRELADYTSINDLRRVGGQPFLANRFVLTHRFSPLKGSGTATIRGLPVLLAKNLQGNAPKLALFANRPGPHVYTYDLALDLHLYDNLQVVGDGNQQFIVTGDLIEVREGLDLTKTGKSTLTLKGNYGLTGKLNIKEGNVLAANAQALGKGDIALGRDGSLRVNGPMGVGPNRRISIQLNPDAPDTPAIEVQAEATLAGTLHIDAAEIEPMPGQRYVLLRADEIDQGFDAIDGLRLDEHHELIIDQSATELALVVCPVPDDETHGRQFSKR